MPWSGVGVGEVGEGHEGLAALEMGRSNVLRERAEEAETGKGCIQSGEALPRETSATCTEQGKIYNERDAPEPVFPSSTATLPFV